jgi:hypothetical protein
MSLNYHIAVCNAYHVTMRMYGSFKGYNLQSNIKGVHVTSGKPCPTAYSISDAFIPVPVTSVMPCHMIGANMIKKHIAYGVPVTGKT